MGNTFLLNINDVFQHISTSIFTKLYSKAKLLKIVPNILSLSCINTVIN